MCEREGGRGVGGVGGEGRGGGVVRAAVRSTLRDALQLLLRITARCGKRMHLVRGVGGLCARYCLHKTDYEMRSKHLSGL